MSDAALQAYMAPLRPYLDDPELEEVIINHPGEIYVERAGVWACHAVAELDSRRLNQLAELTATFTQQKVGPQTPLLSAFLPGGQRIQIVLPPACPPNMFGVAIRKPSQRELSLQELRRRGCLDLPGPQRTESHETPEDPLAEALRQGDTERFLRLAVRSRKNVLISGGTSTGKTTVMRALTEEIGPNERIITIEDVREIQLRHANKLHLLASKGGQGVAAVTFGSLLEACLRLRPDRILLGEMRGGEAADFLELINTGHPGSISTIHADSPRLCFERLAFMVKRREGFQTMSHEALVAYIQSVVDVVVQFKRLDAGRRVISDIWYAGAR